MIWKHDGDAVHTGAGDEKLALVGVEAKVIRAHGERKFGHHGQSWNVERGKGVGLRVGGEQQEAVRAEANGSGRAWELGPVALAAREVKQVDDAMRPG